MAIKARVPQIEDWKAQVKCQAGCPVATDAGRYVQLIAEGRDEEAFLVARAPNPFASVCGRVCAAPCEDACRRGAIDAPIAIRALKRFATERFGVESVHPDAQDQLLQILVPEGNRYAGHLPVSTGEPTSPAQRGRRVAIVGAGPSGLAAAHDLALLGYQVTIFEAADEPGGAHAGPRSSPRSSRCCPWRSRRRGTSFPEEAASRTSRGPPPRWSSSCCSSFP
jgi:NADPH-dependent glutamate synthase beta subunit-like oxidoreductase